uniref:Uncharacterized protein n=1 Tax=Anguilla anguilla TaxID=7936 RepID=A0A0E9VL98_ANGAN
MDLFAISKQDCFSRRRTFLASST